MSEEKKEQVTPEELDEVNGGLLSPDLVDMLRKERWSCPNCGTKTKADSSYICTCSKCGCMWDALQGTVLKRGN